MITHTFKCDQCGTELVQTTTNNPDGWQDVEVRAGRLGYDRFRFSKRLLLCHGCAAKVGVSIENPTDSQEESVADRLYEIIADMVSDVQGGA